MTPPAAQPGSSAMFRSFSAFNYRVWFIGALVSNIGAWMQATAISWVVLTELTDNDALAVGITMALQFAPQLLLVPVTGLIADRFERRKVLMLTQSALMVLGLALGALLILGHAELWHLYVFAGLLGIVNAVDIPARQTFVADLVSSSNMSNAVALNSASFNAARMIGPSSSVTRCSPMKKAERPYIRWKRSSGSIRSFQSALSRVKSTSWVRHCWRSHSSYSSV